MITNYNPTAFAAHRSIILRLVQFNAQKEHRQLCAPLRTKTLSSSKFPIFRSATTTPIKENKREEKREKREERQQKENKERREGRNKRKKNLRERCAFNVKDKPAGISSKGSMARTG